MFGSMTFTTFLTCLLLIFFLRGLHSIRDDKYYHFYYFVALCLCFMTIDISLIAKDVLEIKEHLIPKVENKDKLPETSKDYGKQNNI